MIWGAGKGFLKPKTRVRVFEHNMAIIWAKALEKDLTVCEVLKEIHSGGSVVSAEGSGRIRHWLLQEFYKKNLYSKRMKMCHRPGGDTFKLHYLGTGLIPSIYKELSKLNKKKEVSWNIDDAFIKWLTPGYFLQKNKSWSRHQLQVLLALLPSGSLLTCLGKQWQDGWSPWATAHMWETQKFQAPGFWTVQLQLLRLSGDWNSRWKIHPFISPSLCIIFQIRK